MTAGILDPSPALATAQLSTTEQDLIARIDGETKNAHTVAKVAAAFGAALFVYRLYMRRRLREEMKEKPPEQLPVIAGAVFGSFLPVWVRLVAPAVLAGYLEGQAAVNQGKVPEPYLMDVADGYARRLGEHINGVSYDALMQGFHAQVNRRVPARRAVENVVSAYGVPVRTMNALVKIWTGEDTKVLSRTPTGSRRDAQAAALIEKAFKLRAEQFGDTEAWTARSQAKQLVWMYGIRNGTIPENATRVWRTARDERVCPACGPLDKTEVPVKEAFRTDAGEFWSPPLHPKCRCDIDLAVDLLAEFRPAHERVGKNMGDDPFDRDRRGRFSAREERAPQPRPQTARAYEPVSEPEQQPETLEERLERLGREKAELEAARKKKKEAERPLNLSPIKLGVKLGPTKLNLTPVKLDAPKPKEQAATGAPKEKVALPSKAVDLGKVKLKFQQISLPTFVEPAPSKVAVSVPQGYEQPRVLDQPVYGIKHKDLAQRDILTSEADDVFTKDQVSEGLKEYWWNVITEDLIGKFQPDMSEGHHWIIYRRQGVKYMVDEDVYGQVWMEAIDGKTMNSVNTHKVMLEKAPGTTEWVTISSYDIAEYTGIHQKMREEMPVVFRMDWYWPSRATGVGGATKSGAAQNPGEWQVQDKWDDGMMSKLPHIRANTTPIS